ncbi:MAG TPA: 4Fe-4S dicluster domain-containing protein [Chloroflexia bacterium]|nr:4Fe-4S dicluster domain-containing protein [Chloroflexia bacterium]
MIATPDKNAVTQAGEVAHAVIEAADLQHLFDALRQRGYELYGPTVNEGAIVYDRIHSAADLPAGWTDEQAPGYYRLVRRNDGALFSYGAGPHSWKRLLHPPTVQLFHAKRDENGDLVTVDDTPAPVKRAFIGVRSCDLAAIGVQDRVFLGGPFVDPQYKARREGNFIVAVNCSHSGANCFCVSMGTGPRAYSGFDLSLTEVLAAGRHYFVVETGSEAGAEMLAGLPHHTADVEELEGAECVVAKVAFRQAKKLETAGLAQALKKAVECPMCEDIAKRCLTCGNCTMVCPTCFCTTVDDVNSLAGDEASRVRRWDSCFTLGFSYIHGGSVRVSPQSRYRQWLTHKLGTWFDQFGTYGCVGCGRCITWCPVGIDITEEAARVKTQVEAMETGAV